MKGIFVRHANVSMARLELCRSVLELKRFAEHSDSCSGGYTGRGRGVAAFP
jgi:hypothetical protein